MIEPTLGLAAILADNDKVVKTETPASLGRNFSVDLKSPRLDRPATVMTMMASQIMVHEMPQIS